MSKHADIANLKPGESIPDLVHGPITRTELALFAGASGDHNPIHLDDAAAQAGGLPGVIVHGMLMMAILGRMLTEQVSQSQVRRFSNRFAAMAVPGDTITCRGVVTEKRELDGETLIDLDVNAANQDGAVLLKGSATLAVTGA